VDQLFPYDNIVAGLAVFIVGFVFHWVGQLVSLLNWEFATKLGIQERGMLPEYKVYEHAIAKADVSLGWIHGLASIGLVFGADWGFKLAWISAAILVYHGLSFWFWTVNQRRAGNQLTSAPLRIIWSLANITAGLFTMMVTWAAQ